MLNKQSQPDKVKHGRFQGNTLSRVQNANKTQQPSEVSTLKAVLTQPRELGVSLVFWNDLPTLTWLIEKQIFWKLWERLVLFFLNVFTYSTFKRQVLKEMERFPRENSSTIDVPKMLWFKSVGNPVSHSNLNEPFHRINLVTVSLRRQ